MTKVIENKKGFLILEVGRADMALALQSPGVCDHCNQTSETGFLIAVLNHWCCTECYNAWYNRAKRYEQDIPYEKNVFIRHCMYFKNAGIVVEGLNKEKDVSNG